MRKASVKRTTKETAVEVAIDLDGEGRSSIATGIGFLDHMLDQLAKHSLIDIILQAKGDLHIDFHHTTEDTGYVIGAAVAKALGDRAGIQRYGSAMIPFDWVLEAKLVLSDELMKRGADQRAARIEHQSTDLDEEG